MGSNSIGAAAGRPVTDVEDALGRLAAAQGKNAEFANNLATRASVQLETVLQDGSKPADPAGATREICSVKALPRTPLLRDIEGAIDREEVITRRLQDIENVLDRVVL